MSSFSTPPKIELIYAGTNKVLESIEHDGKTYYIAEPEQNFMIRYYLPKELPKGGYVSKVQIDGKPTGFASTGVETTSCITHQSLQGENRAAFALRFGEHMRLSLNKSSKSELNEEIKIGKISGVLYSLVKEEIIENIKKSYIHWKSIEQLNTGKEKFGEFNAISTKHGRVQCPPEITSRWITSGVQIPATEVTVFYDTLENLRIRKIAPPEDLEMLAVQAERESKEEARLVLKAKRRLEQTEGRIQKLEKSLRAAQKAKADSIQLLNPKVKQELDIHKPAKTFLDPQFEYICDLIDTEDGADAEPNWSTKKRPKSETIVLPHE